MDNLNPLPQKDVSEEGDIADHRRQDALIIESLNGKVINFQTIGHVSDSSPLSVGMSHNNNLEIHAET